MIDMQRDFMEPGGFGAALGNDVSRLALVHQARRSADRCLPQRAAITIVHTQGVSLTGSLRLSSRQAGAGKPGLRHR